MPAICEGVEMRREETCGIVVAFNALGSMIDSATEVNASESLKYAMIRAMASDVNLVLT